MNNVNLIGRLTRDPELRYLESGKAVANFTIAVDKMLSKERREEFEANNKPTADFIRIQSWGKQAESVANNLVKGLQVAINGRIQTGSYDDADGKRIYTTEVVANQVKFLEWADSNEQKGKAETNQETQNFAHVDDDDIPF